MWATAEDSAERWSPHFVAEEFSKESSKQAKDGVVEGREHLRHMAHA